MTGRREDGFNWADRVIRGPQNEIGRILIVKLAIVQDTSLSGPEEVARWVW